MYTGFYNLRERPFEITPDPRFLYLSENHREGLAHLQYAVKERRGFTVITGEVGTGKTTLVQTLLSRLDGTTRTAYLFNPKMGPNDFLQYICEDLGVKGSIRTKREAISELHKFLLECYRRNENVVLIVDEAQNLDRQLLEEVRLLTNLETAKNKLLQVILIGQPELNDVLNDSKTRALKQRIGLRYHIKPLNRDETHEYIKVRLKRAGAIDANIFTPKAVDLIYRYSKGIPRSINIVCDNALLSGYGSDQKVIGEEIIKDVIRSLEGPETVKNRKGLILLVLGVGLVVGFAAVLLWRPELLRGLKEGAAQFVEKLEDLMANISRLIR